MPGAGGREKAKVPAAELLLHNLVAHAPVVLWAIDRDGIFTLSEGKALSSLGLRPGQVVGMSAFDVYADSAVVVEELRRGLAGEAGHWEVELGGATFETRSNPIFDASGKIAGLVGVSLDVSERIRATREREELNAQMLQVQKLEGIGVLAGGIAHDFNNLLTAILGSTSTSLLHLPPEHPARRELDNVVTAARRAAQLTRQLLAYSGRGTFEVRPIDLSAHVQELVELLETVVPKKAQIRLQLAAELPAVKVDVAQFQQLVMNLVINAGEAIGDAPGTVLITSDVQDVDASYAGTLVGGDKITPGRYVMLEVHDTGHGMDEQTKRQIFEPFFTTKLTGRGLGLAAGLSIVRSHGGALKVYSSPGSGTTFKVLLPASEEAPTTVSTETSPMNMSGLALVIDDDSVVRMTTASMLEHMGFAVLQADNGRRGAEIFAEHADEIVLVVLDMTMPEMDGAETFRELRRIRSDARVLLTSGYNEVEATQRFTGKGLAGFIQKPYALDDLVNKIRTAFERR